MTAYSVITSPGATATCTSFSILRRLARQVVEGASVRLLYEMLSAAWSLSVGGRVTRAATNGSPLTAHCCCDGHLSASPLTVRHAATTQLVQPLHLLLLCSYVIDPQRPHLAPSSITPRS